MSDTGSKLAMGILLVILVALLANQYLQGQQRQASEVTTGSTPAAATITSSAWTPQAGETTATVTVVEKTTVTKTVTKTLRKTITTTLTTTTTTTTTRTATTTIYSTTTTTTATSTAAQPKPAAIQALLDTYTTAAGREAWWAPRPVEITGLLFSHHGLEVYSADNGLLVIVNRLPDPSNGYTYTIEDTEGHELLVLWPFSQNKTSNGVPAVPSTLSIVNKTLALGTWPVKTLASLGRGEYRLVAFQKDNTYVACSFRVTGANSIVFTGRCSTGPVIPSTSPGPVMGSYTSILDALVNGVTEPGEKILGATIYDNKATGSPAANVWRLLAWEEEHLAYDYQKYRAIESGIEVGVQGPLETLRRGEGVCSDYAVFTAAGLDYLGLPAMVLVFPRAYHAAAATVLGNTVIVLDQKTPPAELEDYLQYVIPGERQVTVYLLAGTSSEGSTVVAYRLNTAKARDSYPADRLDEKTLLKAIRIAAEKLGLEGNPSLATVVEWLGAYYGLRIPVLEEVEARPAPLDAFYTPIFQDQWALLLSGYIEELVQKYYPDTIGRGSLWATILHEEDRLVLRTYAVPIRYHVEVASTSNGLRIVVESQAIGNPVKDVSLLVYRAGERNPCAGIAPPGYTYSSIPYISAKTWRGEAGRAEIVIDPAKLQQLITGCGPNARIGVWIRDSLVYLAKP